MRRQLIERSAAWQAAGIGAGRWRRPSVLLCGFVNGVCVAVFRFQPLVTTFATSIFFAGLALRVLPQAGGPVPAAFWRTYSGSIFGVASRFRFCWRPVRWPVLARAQRLVSTTAGDRRRSDGGLSNRLAGRVAASVGYALWGLFASLAALCLAGDTASADPLLGRR